MGWTETPLISPVTYAAESKAVWGIGSDGYEQIMNIGELTPVESAKASADRLSGAPGHCYAITRKALEELGCGIRSVPMPNCPHAVLYDGLTDNYVVVRAPDDLGEINISKFLSTTLAVFRGANLVSIFFRAKD